MRRIPGGALVKFFILTYAVMWTCFITVAAAAIPATVMKQEIGRAHV